MRLRLLFATDLFSWGRALFEPFALGVRMSMRDAMRHALRDVMRNAFLIFSTFFVLSSGSGHRLPFWYGGALSDAVARRGSHLLWRLVVGCPSSLYALRRRF